MNYVDKHLKNVIGNETIGIISCHKNNKLVMDYASASRIIAREYILN